MTEHSIGPGNPNDQKPMVPIVVPVFLQCGNEDLFTFYMSLKYVVVWRNI